MSSVTGRKPWGEVFTLADLPKEIKFYHYSSEPLVKLYNAEYEQERHFKPSGFWFSVEGIEGDTNWYDWCTGEDFALNRLKYRTEIKINSDRVLVLTDAESILHFNTHFGERIVQSTKLTEVDWKPLVFLYDGIIIAPYQWGLRFHPEVFWYYGWDCASGCVWNTSVVELGESILLETLDRVE